VPDNPGAWLVTTARRRAIDRLRRDRVLAGSRKHKHQEPPACGEPASVPGGVPEAEPQPPFSSIESMLKGANPRNCCMTLKNGEEPDLERY
jgi:DNA-directed RNA polymerase specialized sigma24 family protein